MCTVPTTTPQKTCYLVMSGVLVLTILWVFSRRFSQDLSLDRGLQRLLSGRTKVDCENKDASDSSSTHAVDWSLDDPLAKFVTGFPEKPLTFTWGNFDFVMWI